jgi:hypothetical protein
LLITHLHNKNVHYLYQARAHNCPLRSPGKWLSNTDLGLNAELATDWNAFVSNLSLSGITLNESVDQLKWWGGDHSGIITVQNIYTTILNSIWHNNTRGWRKHLWTWRLPTKIKLFTWLMFEYKLNTWDTLQRKGWTGPNICSLCLIEAETTDHLFIKCPYTRKVWDLIASVLNFKTFWDGPTLADCFESWTRREHNLKQLPSLVCWTIWLDKNLKSFF